ncbi:MAG: hypothetical protein IID33_12970 [Planctomycetes bacterium]|nr:hypothetical protein [Planctomycetota bacterium]
MNDAHLRKAVTDAVDLVNSHSGAASVRLEFNSETVPPIDFVANSGSFEGENFIFTAGFETYGGSMEELKNIRAELIGY